MDYHLLQQQLGRTAGCGRAIGYDAYTHALVRRLHNTQDVSTASESTAVAWDDRGILLACAGEDCTMRLWNNDRGLLACKYEPGHTEPITCTGFLPATGGRLLVSAGPSQDIRMTDLERQATRPYTTGSNIKTLLPISSAVFASGGEDGKLRCFDSRQCGALGTQQDDKHNVLVDQGAEALSSSGRVSILSMSQDPVNQQYIATGGSDPYGEPVWPSSAQALVRVYDVRMMRPSSRSVWRKFTSGPSWCYCLAPTMFRQRSTGHSCQVSSVTFDPNGQRLLAGYAGKDIYSFDVQQHACSYSEVNGRQQQRQGSGRRSTRARRRAAAGMPGEVGGYLTSGSTAAASRMSRAQQQLGNQRQEQQQQPPSVAGAAAAAEATAAAAPVTQPPDQRTRRSRNRPQMQEAEANHSMIESPAGSLRATQPAEPSPVQQDEEQQGQTASQFSSGASGSDNRNSGSDEEVILAAEVHLLGPDGTVLHTTRIPLQRGPAAAAEAILRGGNHLQPAAATTAAIVNSVRQQQQHQSEGGAGDRSMQQQQQEGLRPPGEPLSPGHLAAEMLPSRQILQHLHQDAHARFRQLETAHFAAQERLRALEELHRLQERAEVLRAEQEQLIRLRDALTQLAPGDAVEGGAAEGRQLVADDSAATEASAQLAACDVAEGTPTEGRQLAADDPAATASAVLAQLAPGNRAGGREQVIEGLAAVAGLAEDLQAAGGVMGAAQQQLDAPEQPTSSVAAAHTAPGQQQPSTAAAATTPAEREGSHVSTQRQLLPVQQDFLAQVHATAADFAVPQQQPPGPSPGLSVLRPIPVIDAGGRGSAGMGAGRRVRRPRRSSRTVFVVPAEPTTADTDLVAAPAGAAAEGQQQQGALSPLRRSGNSSAAEEEEPDEAEVNAAGSNQARLHTLGSNMAFMGLGGSGAGSSRNIGNISPSVVAAGGAAAAFINGRDPAAAAADSGQHQSRLQQQQQQAGEQQATSTTSTDSDEPASKRTRRDVASSAGAPGRIPSPARQHRQQQELPFGALLTGQQQPQDAVHVPDLQLEPAVPTDARHTAVAAPLATSTAVPHEQVAGGGAHLSPIASSFPAAATVSDRQTGAEQQQAPQQQLQHQEPEHLHQVAQQQQDQQLQELQMHTHHPASPRLLELQQGRHRNHHQRQQQRQQQHEVEDEEDRRPTRGLDVLFGALMNNIGHALATAADGQEVAAQVEVHIPLTLHANGASLGHSRRGRTAGVPAAHTSAAHTGAVSSSAAHATNAYTTEADPAGGSDPATVDRSDGAVDKSEDPAAMLRAELGLPMVSRAQALKQVQKWQRQRSGQAGSRQYLVRQGQQQQQQQQVDSEAASIDLGLQQQPEALQQQQQSASQQQQQDHQQLPIQLQRPQRRQGVKRKRSDSASQQVQLGRASTATTALATPQGLVMAPGAATADADDDEEEEEADPPADSDAAFIAALSGRRSSRRRRDMGEPGEPAASAIVVPAAVAAASGADPTAASAAVGHPGSAAVRRRTRSSRSKASGLSAEQHQQHGFEAASAAAEAAAEAGVTTTTGVRTRRRRQQEAQQAATIAAAAVVSPGNEGDSSDMPSLVDDYLADRVDEQDGPFRFSLWQAAAAGVGAGDGAPGGGGSTDSDSDTDEHISRGYSCCYRGHMNLLSSRNAAWLGSRGEYVVSGSDDGCLFVWDAASGDVVNVVTGGDKSIRRVQVNPMQQLLLATCGPEPVVRLWSPTADVPADPLQTAAAVEQSQAGAAAAPDDIRRMVNHGFANMISRWAERVMGGERGSPILVDEGLPLRGVALRPLNTANRLVPPQMPQLLPPAPTLAAAQGHGAVAAGVTAEGSRRYQTRSATAAAAAGAGQDGMRNMQQGGEVRPARQQQQQQQEDDSDEPPPLDWSDEDP